MFSFENLDETAKKIMTLLGVTGNIKNSFDKRNDAEDKGNKETKNSITLSPSQLLVISGFLGGVLEVESVLVDKDQEVQIVLSGTLKRKTQLEKVMEQVGKMPFEQVVKAIIKSS